MTNPMENAYKAIMDTYNPLEVKDIISCGAARQAKYHKTKDEILEFYAEHNEGMHHELLDANEDVFKSYAFMQYCYNQSSKSDADQWEFIKDVLYLYIDLAAHELADTHDLYDKSRKQIEDEVLRIDLAHRQKQIQEETNAI